MTTPSISRNISNGRGTSKFRCLATAKATPFTSASAIAPLQRRHQKVWEEGPSPALNAGARDAIGETVAKAMREIGYLGAGTVEFLYEDGKFYFIEMNTRIQVEHPVTEMITDIDLIFEQIRVAAGSNLAIQQQDVKFHGHAIECRINAENPVSFRPSPGKIMHYHPPGGLGVRIDSAVYQGYSIPPYYDSLVGKLIVHGKTRTECLMRLKRALDEVVVDGIETTLPLSGVGPRKRHYRRQLPYSLARTIPRPWRHGELGHEFRNLLQFWCLDSARVRIMANRENTFIEITPEVLLKAYACGIFPMAESADDPALYWIEPDMRGIIPLEGFHVPARLARTVRATSWTIHVDRDFDAVIEGCAEPKPDRARTWINTRIRRIYRALFERGHCHTVEVYDGETLVGGLYGVSLGRAFFGESMFHRARDASKVALVHLIARLKSGGYRLLDTQYVTEHPKNLRRGRSPEATLPPPAGRGVDRRRRFRGAAPRSAWRRRGVERLLTACDNAARCSAMRSEFFALRPRFRGDERKGILARRREKPWWRRHALRRGGRLLGTPLLLLLLLPCRLPGPFRFRNGWALSTFAVGDPDVVDRVLNCMQARARGEHPSGENSLDLSLQRHLVDLDKGIRIWRFRRRARIRTRGVICRAPNCTVSLIDTSKEMMRPVILSRPANTAVGLVMRCGGGSTTTASLCCGAVFVGCGALRGEPGPGGKADGA